MWAIIATWRMSAEGLAEATKLLEKGEKGDKALVKAITMVEDFPYYKSVGYGGLPNENGIVELDAGFMNGDTLAVGAVASVHDIANPVLVAQKLSEYSVNSFLVGEGAEEFAIKEGFARKTMLTERAKQHYQKRLSELKNQELKAYIGHDTVAGICLDTSGSMYSATSTSGLFMKKHGRIGDSPICGSGFYVDSEIGGAGATGLGEDLMKGATSYEIVSLMKQGLTAQQACDIAVNELDSKLKKRQGKAGDISVVALSKNGDFGVATNIDTFSFVVATSNHPLAIYLCEKDGIHTKYRKADKEWLEAYQKRIHEPIL
ncbi:MAG: N(4)-(beta-N-acetylglucosaminyl)-L-asparaginase [Alphaproteobacteria bacterium]|jgi:N4-(beta-N-acetylglucosaminyl)-L-asparaginase|nr:N(4)-(beta-N-acetylglucosaminyl)-L-asparaginase [Alphaproteobacteria bacterium]